MIVGSVTTVKKWCFCRWLEERRGFATRWGLCACYKYHALGQKMMSFIEVSNTGNFPCSILSRVNLDLYCPLKVPFDLSRGIIIIFCFFLHLFTSPNVRFVTHNHSSPKNTTFTASPTSPSTGPDQDTIQDMLGAA